LIVLPADGSLAAPQPGKDFGTSCFKGYFDYFMREGAVMEA
jgi:hypothetical protein